MAATSGERCRRGIEMGMNDAQIKGHRALQIMTATIVKKDGLFVVQLNGKQIGSAQTYAGARELLVVEEVETLRNAVYGAR